MPTEIVAGGKSYHASWVMYETLYEGDDTNPSRNPLRKLRWRKKGSDDHVRLPLHMSWETFTNNLH
jgi:hypothetical protein